MNLLRLPDAARMLGISYPTLKQWIYSEKIRSVKTAGGHHRISPDEIDRLLAADRRGNQRNHERASAEPGLDAISGRNKLFETVAEVRIDGLLAQILINIGANQQMVSIITADSARSLDLKKGANVYALVKATEVMVIRAQ